MRVSHGMYVFNVAKDYVTVLIVVFSVFKAAVLHFIRIGCEIGAGVVDHKLNWVLLRCGGHTCDRGEEKLIIVIS
jgi:hypothetical protein